MHAERSEFRQLAQEPREVMRLALGVGVVSDMVSQWADDLHLYVLDLVRLLQAVTLWERIQEEIINIM